MKDCSIEQKLFSTKNVLNKSVMDSRLHVGFKVGWSHSVSSEWIHC